VLAGAHYDTVAAAPARTTTRAAGGLIEIARRCGLSSRCTVKLVASSTRSAFFFSARGQQGYAEAAVPRRRHPRDALVKCWAAIRMRAAAAYPPL